MFRFEEAQKLMTRRYVTIQEANDMLPAVQRSFFLIDQLQGFIHRSFDALDGMGAAPDSDDFEVFEDDLSDEALAARAELKGLIETLHDEIEALEDRGCIVKDIEEAIVGWYCNHPEFGEIFLSWQRGERYVAHWHEVNTGYVQRRPLSELR